MIAGSVVLTGVFTEVAAHAFPGKAAKPRAAAAHGASQNTSKGSSGGTSEKPLAAPSQAPQAEEPRAQEASPAAGIGSADGTRRARIGSRGRRERSRALGTGAAARSPERTRARSLRPGRLGGLLR